MDQNPYVILNIPYNANSQAIKSAYKKLALKHHPDICQDDGQMFLRIKKAYEILIDPQKRRRADIDLLSSNHLINLKNNTFDYKQLLTILNKLELEVQSPAHSNINKELLGEYLLWLYNENRIYNIIQNTDEKGLHILVRKTTGLLKQTDDIHKIKFYRHIIFLNKHFNKTLIKEPTLNHYISQINKKIVYNKYKLIILLFTSIIVCFIIFFASK